ncbi:MAG: amino acid adenylation domain-containing protein, partial [Candidatus Methanomethylophilaceae archaeon]|nr:amino acid adenylation domain-containing protein [Candidatus Methanomethylophilaceae archaeon]
MVDVTVQAVSNGPGKELCAYVVGSAEADEVKGWVSERKPPYMVPAFVVPLESIPRTVNGKVDRRALPAPDASSLRAEYAAPRSETERKLCEAMASVLGVERVGMDDDFVRLGGDSLKAVRLAAACRSMGMAVPAQEIIARRTARSISPLISSAVDAGTYSGPIGLSPVQERLMSAGTTSQRNRHNQSVLLRSSESLDLDTVQKALDAVTDHHDMLRAVYSAPYHVREPGISVCRAARDPASTHEEMTEAMDRAQGSLSLENGRNMACLVFSADADYVFIVIHHMVVDGASWSFILDDFSSAYRSINSGKTPVLPPRTASYASWLDACSRPPRKEESDYWAEAEKTVPDAVRVSDVEQFSLVSEFPLPSAEDGPFGFDSADILAAALAEAYSEVSREDGVAVRMEGHGRSEAGVERTVGWFTDMYPLRLASSGDPLKDLFDARKRLHDVPRGGIGYESVLRGRPLPQITLNYLSNAFSFSDGLFETVLDIPMGRFSDVPPDDRVSLNVNDVGGVFAITGYHDGSDAMSKLPKVFLEKIKAVSEAAACPRMLMRPLSEGQLNVYLDEMAERKGTAYNAPGMVPVKGIPKESIRKAVEAVTEAHPVLKSRIVECDGAPWMVADSYPEISEGPLEGFARPFDLGGCLSRFRISDDYLVWDVHHAVMDASSRNVLIQDFRKALSGMGLDLDVRAFDVSDWQSPENTWKAMEFFDKMLDGADTDPGIVPDLEGSYGSSRAKLSCGRKDVEELATSNGVAIGSLFASVFAYTLSRFTGRSDAVFVFTDTGRAAASMSDAVGMFVRTVPIRVDCTDAPVKEYLRKASFTHIEAMSNDFVPFRDLSRRHGVNVSVLFEYNASINTDFDNEASAAGPMMDVPPEYGIVSDVQCVVTDSEGSFDVAVYHSDKIGEETAMRMVRVFDSVLDGMTRCEKMSGLEIASDDDTLLSEKVNDTSKTLRFGDVLEAFAESVSRFPDKPFVVSQRRSLSYAECDRISDAVACSLENEGIGLGDSVAVLVPRGEWYVLCALGALKAGAAYVPMDSAYPDERLAYIIKDSSSKAVLCVPETMDRCKSLTTAPAIDCSSLADSHPKKIETDGSTPMVVLYTSGTTGKPKGSVLTRLAIENLAEWYCEYTRISAEDVVGMHTSYSFDMHAVAIYPPMLAGGSVYIVPEEARRDLEDLDLRLEEAGVTHIFITTQLGKLYASKMRHPLKVLVLAGEKLGPFSPPEGLRTIDAYGPSENHVSTAVDVSDRCCPYSVGKPLPNVKAYVLDAEKRHVPYGAVGELHLSGYQLSLGYLNRDDLNSIVFTRNPFSDEPGFERMYATGDFARLLPDGTIGILGRRDGQVKIRGNRVELTEVEAAIREIPGVRDVTVQAVSNGPGKELCAYVVGDVDAEEVKAWVSGRRPDYMVPAFVVNMGSIPLNVNGKVDWRALPAPDASSLKAGYVAPRNADESAICKAFEKVLKIEKVGIDDDFIRLGGDSMKAIEVQSALRKASAADILRYRTPRSVASHSLETYAALRYAEEDGCPLSESQLNVYLDMMANPDSGEYVIPFSFQIPENVSEPEARAALDKTIVAHPALRGRVADNDGIPWMFFDAVPEMGSGEPATPVISKCTSSFVMSGNTIKGMISHLAFDGYSSAVLSNDLSASIAGKTIEHDKGVLISSSFDQSIPESDRYSDAERFFDAMLCDADTDIGLMEDLDGSVGTSTIVLSCDAESLASKAASCGSSPGALATSAFAYALSRFTGRSDAVFCIAENGRDVPGLERSVGMFVRTVPVRIDCSDTQVDGFVSKASETVYGAMSAGFVPFRKLSSEYGVKPDVIFQYAPKGEASELMEGILSGSPDMFSSSGVSVAVMDLPDELRATISHGRRISVKTAEGILKALDRTLSGMLELDRMSDIIYVDPEDADGCFADGGRARIAYDSVIGAMRSRISDKVMITYLDRSYSYRMADMVTDGIASRLSKTGVEKGDRVAFLVPRSEWYVLCAIGVMKTGAAYVPMDGAYPDERLSFMARDSGIKAILATQETMDRAWSISGVETIDCTTCGYEGDAMPDPSPESEAVILYTSGTTGKPKGTAITHKGLSNLAEYFAKSAELSNEDRIGLFASIGFDANMSTY